MICQRVLRPRLCKLTAMKMLTGSKKVKRKISSQEQTDYMYQAMTDTPEIAEDREKEIDLIYAFWEILAGDLNNLKGPIKQATEWRKSWLSSKARVLSLWSEYERDLDNGETPKKFTPRTAKCLKALNIHVPSNFVMEKKKNKQRLPQLSQSLPLPEQSECSTHSGEVHHQSQSLEDDLTLQERFLRMQQKKNRRKRAATPSVDESTAETPNKILRIDSTPHSDTTSDPLPLQNEMLEKILSRVNSIESRLREVSETQTARIDDLESEMYRMRESIGEIFAFINESDSD